MSQIKNGGLFEVVYGLGKMAMREHIDGLNREISFSPLLRDRIGHHIYGERWAHRIKSFLKDKNLPERLLDIISANLHSVMNCLYALRHYTLIFQRRFYGRRSRDGASKSREQESKRSGDKVRKGTWDV